jgi:putative spermidine/putrescine transport system permease protein
MVWSYRFEHQRLFMAVNTIHTRKPIFQSWAAWFGLLPFFFFGFAFEIIPVIRLIRSSLTDVDGGLTLVNYARVMTPLVTQSFQNSFKLSALTALSGTILGTLVAYAIINTRNKVVSESVTALADVTTNFGGAPLAFAFIITLGSTGIVTLIIKKFFGISLYPNFRIYSIFGLGIAYLYFQIPLMVLIMIPSILGLKREWREAASNLGASSFQFWRRIGLPILAPSLIGGFILLFANSFGAYATAWTLTGPEISLVPIQIAALIRGEVQLDPGAADALASLSLLVMAACVVGYQIAIRRARRFQR